ncbi:barstar family protein [Hymenobacter sp. GOD-10R]|uniref:barstar family protein n=1 Tax=Hymenobacter sp. GOD-10R TaxID=3093922 RepID=UPI002D78AAE5|nr:barstar family protein [Hymenobacter sp. GOD-10R]WRQ27965.1 barstar family protein [Hymenobacter sp. GOD-10R]
MTIDLRGISSKPAFHELVKRELGFPEWYGVGWASWDAFWDCIVAVVQMPQQLTFINWEEFAETCPKDMGILRQVIKDYEEYRPAYRMSLA